MSSMNQAQDLQTSSNHRQMISADQVNPISMMFDPIIAERVYAIAQTLAKGRVTVPAHLQNNLGDCLAIVMQAASWRLNPFAVAQKTHLIHGKLGYEAQLINSVVSSLGLLNGRFRYEYIGDWSKIAVRPRILKSNKGEYPVPGWKEEQENGLGLRVTGKLKGEAEPLIHELWLATVWPRNSTLWATTPQQQISYLGVKQWVRKYAPEAILGVYTTDEIDERVIDADVIEPGASEATASIMEKARNLKKEKAEEVDNGVEDEIAEEVTEENRSKDFSVPDNKEDWIDSRGVPFNPNVHASTRGGVPAMTAAGQFRKKRGCDPQELRKYEDEALEKVRKEAEFLVAVENEQENETEIESEPTSEDDQETKLDSKTKPMFDEEWFDEMINDAISKVELEELTDVLRTTLDSEGIDQTTYHRIFDKIEDRLEEIAITPDVLGVKK